MSTSNAHNADGDPTEALRRENADLYAQIKALSQRLAQGSAGMCLFCGICREPCLQSSRPICPGPQSPAARYNATSALGFVATSVSAVCLIGARGIVTWYTALACGVGTAGKLSRAWFLPC